MERRTFVKALPTLPVLTGAFIAQDSNAQDAAAQGGQTGQPSSAKAETGKMPDYAGHLQHSDGAVTGADGNIQPGFKDRTSKADPRAPYQMPLTKEEQDIMDGKQGPELAKVMKIVVASRQIRNSSLRSSASAGSRALMAIIKAEGPQVKSSVCS